MNTNSTIKTWRERIGVGPDFPLHAPTDVERAMEAEIAELRLHSQPQSGRRSAVAHGDDQWIFDLAAAHELPASGLWGPLRFSATGIVAFAQALRSHEEAKS